MTSGSEFIKPGILSYNCSRAEPGLGSNYVPSAPPSGRRLASGCPAELELRVTEPRAHGPTVSAFNGRSPTGGPVWKELFFP